MPTLADKIQHVIVLMMENRSFDHMLGYVPGVGQLTGAESCSSPWGDITVSPEADYVLPRARPAAPAEGVNLADRALAAIGLPDLE